MGGRTRRECVGLAAVGYRLCTAWRHRIGEATHGQVQPRSMRSLSYLRTGCFHGNKCWQAALMHTLDTSCDLPRPLSCTYSSATDACKFQGDMHASYWRLTPHTQLRTDRTTRRQHHRLCLWG